MISALWPAPFCLHHIFSDQCSRYLHYLWTDCISPWLFHRW